MSLRHGLNLEGDALNPNPGPKQRIEMVLAAIEEERQSLLNQIIEECEADQKRLADFIQQAEWAKNRPGEVPFGGSSLGINQGNIGKYIDAHICHMHGLCESYAAIKQALRPKAN